MLLHEIQLASVLAGENPELLAGEWKLVDCFYGLPIQLQHACYAEACKGSQSYAVLRAMRKIINWQRD